MIEFWEDKGGIPNVEMSFRHTITKEFLDSRCKGFKKTLNRNVVEIGVISRDCYASESVIKS